MDCEQPCNSEIYFSLILMFIQFYPLNTDPLEAHYRNCCKPPYFWMLNLNRKKDFC